MKRTGASEADVGTPFEVTMSVRIRPCRRDDLPALEWFGMFTEHREIIERTYERHERGEQIMLVAEANEAPVGQVWIDLVRKAAQGTGVLWAVRVFPWMQRLGLGAHLMHAAEEVLRRRAYTCAELGVEKTNEAARRFYERHGYGIEGSMHEEYDYTTPEGVYMRIPVDAWIMRKHLGAPP